MPGLRLVGRLTELIVSNWRDELSAQCIEAQIRMIIPHHHGDNASLLRAGTRRGSGLRLRRSNRQLLLGFRRRGVSCVLNLRPGRNGSIPVGAEGAAAFLHQEFLPAFQNPRRLGDPFCKKTENEKIASGTRGGESRCVVFGARLFPLSCRCNGVRECTVLTRGAPRRRQHTN